MVSNPRFPQFQVKFLGTNTELNTPPDYLISLSHEMATEGAGNRVTLELFDPSWGLLDVFLQKAQVAASKQLIMQYRYGYHDNMSQLYWGGITQIQPSNITIQGVGLSLKAVDTGVASAFTEVQNERDKNRVYRGKISDIVTEIANSHGWKTDIVETDNVYEYAGREGQVERVWVKGQMGDLEFLKYLSQFARSRLRPGRYIVRLNSEGSDNQTTLTFGPLESAQNSLYKTYKVMYDKMGEVISFEPQIDKLKTIVAGGGTLQCVGRNIATRVQMSKETDSTKHQNSMWLGSRAIMPPGNIARQICNATSPERLEDEMESYFASLASFVQSATMTIVGDPHIRPGNLINILVITPGGYKYYTSGYWRVMKLTNSIKSGDFTTTLELRRNSIDVGSLPNAGPRLQSLSPIW